MKRTKGKITKLIPPFHLVPFLHRRVYGADHHRSDTYTHHTTELRAINGYDLANVLAIHVQCRADRLWLPRTWCQPYTSHSRKRGRLTFTV